MRPRTGAKILWIAMIVVAVLMLHLFVVLLFNPTFKISPYLGGGIAATPFSPTWIETANGTIDRDKEADIYWMRGAAYIFLFLLTQWLFLTPRGSVRPRVTTGGPLPRRAAFAAGFVGMLLGIGFIATLMEIPNLWILLTTRDGLNTPQRFGFIWLLMAAMWLFWGTVFYVYSRGMDRYSAMLRIFRWLIAGTLLETTIAGPAHALIVNARGDECYCQRGTWTGIAFGCTAVFWLFGPGAALLVMREVRRREQLI